MALPESAHGAHLPADRRLLPSTAEPAHTGSQKSVGSYFGSAPGRTAGVSCGLPTSVFLLDGSSLELAHTEDLAAAYPPAENQYGAAHWPILRIAVMHNLANGLAFTRKYYRV